MNLGSFGFMIEHFLIPIFPYVFPDLIIVPVLSIFNTSFIGSSRFQSCTPRDDFWARQRCYHNINVSRIDPFRTAIRMQLQKCKATSSFSHIRVRRERKACGRMLQFQWMLSRSHHLNHRSKVISCLLRCCLRLLPVPFELLHTPPAIKPTNCVGVLRR